MPKVKFTLHFACYFGYMLYSAYVLIGHGTEGEVTPHEVFFWVWATCARTAYAPPPAHPPPCSRPSSCAGLVDMSKSRWG